MRMILCSPEIPGKRCERDRQVSWIESGSSGSSGAVLRASTAVQRLQSKHMGRVLSLPAVAPLLSYSFSVTSGEQCGKGGLSSKMWWSLECNSGGISFIVLVVVCSASPYTHTHTPYS